MKRYERLTEDITASIRSGLLQVGDRLPSVRQTSASRGVSPSTVFKAYYLLEARGLIRARDRSGYYVLRAPQAALPELDGLSSAPAGRHPVDVSDNVLQVLNATLRRDMTPFGSAFPSPSLLPYARLGKFMASAAQRLDPWGSIDDLSPGDAALRRAIALRYLADGLTVPVDDIIITNGALDALNLSLAAVTQPGDAVIVESPTFYAALQSLERNQLHAIEVATHPREGIDLQALEDAIVQHRPRACWLMTTFQNPLGSLMPDRKKEALVRLLTRHDIALIEDDVYGELYFGEHRPRPAKAFDKEGIVMHCSSFSKTLAPGYRVGWVAGGRYARQIMRNKLTTSLATAAPTQAAIAAYLEKGGYDRHLRQFRQALAVQQGELLQAVARYFPKGTRATRPAGGYFVWVELPAHIDTLKVHRAALDHGISIAPGPLFSSSGAFRNFLRLNHGHPWNADMEQGMATLGKLLGGG
ncbi:MULTISPECIES: PLP-dependent aminotransferase family protein [Achromobacter]|uniref:PLP-dependent aminotransferase family protein n=1 Tax=Achromobacter spanius TaxID=217203 RepID=A0ABY8GLU3_9BURK|nr:MULTISPECIES: PLP-dependent aminotransferase family protein [Achromobacter]WAI84957.1 PLP-dependent aminotransferase family protein [Achromobacter spanius]WEX95039.1 PLP-dependent aminotransferase family protein [Achromobacter sp. SS2-2022]WFP05790.1 PLP-dependent aminotransferase family protein [Achromobacter spanius]